MSLSRVITFSVFISAAIIAPTTSMAACSSKVIDGATFTKCDHGSATKIDDTVFYRGADTGETESSHNFNLNKTKKNTPPQVIGNSIVYRPDKNGNGYTGLPDEINGSLYTNLKKAGIDILSAPSAVTSGESDDVSVGDTKVYNTSPIIMDGKVTDELPNAPGITFYRDGGDNKALQATSAPTPIGITDDVADELKEKALERVGE